MGRSVQLAANTRDEDVGLTPSPVLAPTPTVSGIPLRFRFNSFPEALDYAATGNSGINFYSGRLELLEAVQYRDIRASGIDLARRLLGAGLVPGDRVALIAETGADFVRAFAACQYGGFIPAPLPLPQAFGGREVYIGQIHKMMAQTAMSAIISPDWLVSWAEEAASGLGLKWCGTVAQLSACPLGDAELPSPDPDGLSYLQFSSGSTRTPTGVAITHRALMSNTAAIVSSGLGIRPGDRAVSWLPFYHDMGLVGFLLATTVSQMSVDYLATRDFARRPLGWLSLMSANGGTVTYSPSFGYELCAKRIGTGQLPEVDLSHWRVAGIGGDMIRSHVLERFAQTFAPVGFDASAFVPSYGMAETTLAVSFRPLGRGIGVDRVDTAALETAGMAVSAVAGNRARDFVICGRVIPGHDLEIRDEQGMVLAPRRVGRVFVRGPSLMSGYDHRPEETARVLGADGWFDTGDLGYLVGDELVITGRSKDIIIVNGRNLWPQDLEFTAEQIEGVRHGDVAAFSLDQDETEQVVVLVQCRSSAAEVRQALVQSVTAHLRKVHGIEPQVTLVPNNALPMTSSGKLSRSAARKAFLAGSYAVDPAQA